LTLFRELQVSGDMELGSDLDINTNKESLMIKFEEGDVVQKHLEELDKLLGLSQQEIKHNQYKITSNFLKHNENELTIRTRSIASTLFYLSQNMDVPQEHIDAGLVTSTKTKSGELFDWGDTPAGTVFKIRSSEEFPENAYLTVNYRGYWYYIADNDLQSKSTFMLLTQLFGLQAGQSTFSGPTLTLPVR